MKKAAGWCNYMEGILFLVVTAPPPSALPHRPGFVCGGEHLCCNTWQWRASFAAVVLLCSVWSWEALVSPAGGHLFRSTIAFLYLFSLPAVCVGGACCLFLCAFWLLFFFSRPRKVRRRVEGAGDPAGPLRRVQRAHDAPAGGAGLLVPLGRGLVGPRVGGGESRRELGPCRSMRGNQPYAGVERAR